VWGVVAGLVVGALLLVAFVVVQRNGDTPPRVDGGTSTPTPTPTATSSPEPSPVAEEAAIPGVGGDVFLAGGLARVPVPAGWTLLARGDRPDDPGGYSESAVLSDPASGITVAVYLLAESAEPADALAVADERAREWGRDVSGAEFEPAEPVAAVGDIAGAASVRYRYERDSTRVGELVVAIREDGLTLVVFVDGDRTAFQAETWRPLQDDVLESFGA
jgi:hypothetical protein